MWATIRTGPLISASGREYTPKSGNTPSYNAVTNTCSNISCHGAKVTPSWLTGSIDVNTGCTSCHASGTVQYNSYDSGLHDYHINKKIGCAECHDVVLLSAVHFNDLGTPAMNQASVTIRTDASYTNAVNLNGFWSCAILCHNHQHDQDSVW